MPLDRVRIRRSLSRKLKVLLPRKLRFRIYLLRHRRRSYGDHYGLIKRMSTADPASTSKSLLADLFASVCDANEYYRAEFSRCLPGNWRELPVDETLNKLPILTKRHLRDHFASLHTVGEFPYTYRNTSGGSTGQPVVLTQDANYSIWSNATQGYYFREFLGVEMNDVKNVWLWGSERDLPHRTRRARQRHPTVFWRNQTLLNTFDAATDQRWLDYIDFIKRHRPHYVAGYAGSLYQMAKVARRHNVRLYRPQFVYSAAETLRNFMREEIESQFNAKVFDYYGSREVGSIAGECRFGRRHVFVMNNVVEVIPHIDGSANAALSEAAFRPAPSTGSEGEEALPEGRILVTNLHNLAFPLIRYEIGDTGAMGADVGDCPCGSRLPVLAKLTGRVSDHFVRRDGGLVHGEYFTHLFYFRPWVESFRVDQLTHNQIRVQVVRAGEVDEEDVGEITGKIRAAMGEECKVEWRHVDEVEKSAQGKHLYTRSWVEPERAGG